MDRALACNLETGRADDRRNLVWKFAFARKERLA
jgi:hypothetical protein